LENLGETSEQLGDPSEIFVESLENLGETSENLGETSEIFDETSENLDGTSETTGKISEGIGGRSQRARVTRASSAGFSTAQASIKRLRVRKIRFRPFSDKLSGGIHVCLVDIDFLTFCGSFGWHGLWFGSAAKGSCIKNGRNLIDKLAC
jgi:hypothetical protein